MSSRGVDWRRWDDSRRWVKMGVSILGVSKDRSRAHRPPSEDRSSCSQEALGLRHPRMPTSVSGEVAGLHS